MALEEKVNHRLEELHDSKFEIIDGQPDITGWKIKARSGKRIGKVKDMLFDGYSRKVRYLIADLDDNELGLAEDRCVLIPIGIAELYGRSDSYERERVDPALNSYDPTQDSKVVYLPTVTAEQLDALPLYEKDHLSLPVEMAIRRILEPSGHRDYQQEEFYSHEHFNDDRFYHPDHYQHKHKRH